MKTTVCLLLLACLASGQQQFPGGPPAGGATAGGGGGGGPPAGGAAGGGPRFTNPSARFGNRYFGPGLNNPLALRVSDGSHRLATQILGMSPRLQAFVDLDGSIRFTDEFGRSVPRANDLYENVLEQARERAEHQQELFEEQQEARLELQQARLAAQLANSFQRQQFGGQGNAGGFGGGNLGGSGGNFGGNFGGNRGGF